MASPAARWHRPSRRQVGPPCMHEFSARERNHRNTSPTRSQRRPDVGRFAFPVLQSLADRGCPRRSSSTWALVRASSCARARHRVSSDRPQPSCGAWGAPWSPVKRGTHRTHAHARTRRASEAPKQAFSAWRPPGRSERRQEEAQGTHTYRGSAHTPSPRHRVESLLRPPRRGRVGPRLARPVRGSLVRSHLVTVPLDASRRWMRLSKIWRIR